MSHTIYCGKIAKRKNSTLQPSTSQLATSFDVLLKSPTSLHEPTFTINAASFDFNYIKWGDRYYFITDVVSRNNNLWEVTAKCDVLATFKADITASTQFVSYSSHKTSDWLTDTRIPVQKNATVSSNATTMNFLFTDVGFYVLSVIGKNGAELWGCDIGHLRALLNRIQDWSDDLFDDIMAGNYPWSDPPQQAVTYDFSDPEHAIESFSKINALTGIAGNAYSDAPNCIRSCIWVPFLASLYTGGSDEIYLGQFPTGVTTFKVNMTPAHSSAHVDIPWQYNDWRRAVCEEIYLYLPLVGMVSVPSDEIINETGIDVEWSATATDGNIAYRIVAGSQVIGTYGANASANFPLGVSQQASAGEVLQSFIAGAEKTINTATNARRGVVGATAASAAIGAYDTINTSLTRHNTCIGGIGGGAGVGLSLDLKCFSVAHPTTIAPANMKATMGVPTMQPMSLSGLSGYCECANAHVAASGAELPELEEIDSYLNSGFYIE